jgi:hypothetical protein
MGGEAVPVSGDRAKTKACRWDQRTAKQRAYARVFPALVVHEILVRALAVVGVGVSGIKDLGLVQNLMVEAEHTLVLVVSHLT